MGMAGFGALIGGRRALTHELCAPTRRKLARISEASSSIARPRLRGMRWSRARTERRFVPSSLANCQLGRPGALQGASHFPPSPCAMPSRETSTRPVRSAKIGCGEEIGVAGCSSRFVAQLTNGADAPRHPGEQPPPAGSRMISLALRIEPTVSAQRGSGATFSRDLHEGEKACCLPLCRSRGPEWPVTARRAAQSG